MTITQFEQKLEAGTLTDEDRAEFQIFWDTVKDMVPLESGDG